MCDTAAASITTGDEEDGAAEGEGAGDSWQLAYASLQLAAKLFASAPAALDRAAATRCAAPPADGASAAEELRAAARGGCFWTAVRAHLLHPHSWVRLAACRLLGVYLGARDPGTVAQAADAGDEYIARPRVPVQLIRTLGRQVESEHLGDELGLQVVKNLFFLTKLVSAAGDDEPVLWLFKKLAYLSRAEVANRPAQQRVRQVAFKWFAATARMLGTGAKLAPYLEYVLEPLHRTDESEGSPAEVRDLGSQVQELVRGIVGAADFAAAYTRSRDAVAALRRDRKRVRKEELVADPAKAAERKIKRNKSKSDARKRKVDKHRGLEARAKRLAK